MTGDGRALRGRLERQLVVANSVGPILIVLYLVVSGPFSAGQNKWAAAASAFVSLAVALAVLVTAALWRSRRFQVQLFDWIDEDRRPTDEEREALLRAPWQLARSIVPYYVIGSVVAGVATAATGYVGYAVKAVIATNLGALSALAMSYLLVERTLRSTLPDVIGTDHFEKPAAIALRRRLLLGWALGSAIPVVAIAMLPLGRGGHGDYLPVTVPMVMTAIVALVVGSAVTANLASSIAQPLDDVRHGLERVRAGQLDIDVPVNNAGEIGLLQAGFNEMVAGLRQRRQLEDLFGRHVGIEVAQHALDGGIGLRGEQRDVTALFVDLVGSTALAASRPPTEIVELLNALFAVVVQVAETHGGWVNKFEGDAALCVFGAPMEQPDHATRGLRAARQLRTETLQLAERYPALDLGIAVSSGTVVAGNIGSEKRYEYTIIGDAVNEAARLTETAKTLPSRVAASGSAIALADDEAHHWKLHDRIQLRGRTTTTDLYQPTPQDPAAPDNE